MRRWIGKKGIIGYLRFWYYKKRGWVAPNGIWLKQPHKRRGRAGE